MTDQKTVDSDPNTLWTVVVLASFTLLVIASIFALQAYFFRVEKSEMEDKIVDRLPGELLEMKEQQQALLSSYGWIDREAGIVAIPIDRAMEIVVEESRVTGEAR